MKRIYIAGIFKFPRCGATSNYVQYIGCALIKAGYEVNVIAEKNEEYDSDEFRGIKIHRLTKSKGKVSGYLDFYTGMAFKIISVLKKENVSSNDSVMLYTMRPFAVKHITKYCKKNHVKVGNIVTELFEKENFVHPIYYKQYKKMNERYIPKGDYILPISTWIRDYFSQYNIKKLVLPIMADVDEFEHIEKQSGQTKKFIFPGNGKIKDSLKEMVEAIAYILDNYDFDVEFHFCGIKKDEIYKYFKSEEINKKIIIHDWLKYEQLIDLYREMDFLLLARDENQMCKANFPSKVPELMTYGVIPVASIVGDYTKFYLEDNVNSILFYGSDKDAIVNAIMRAYELNKAKQKEMSEAAFNMVKSKLDYRNWDTVLKDFLES